MTRLTTRINGRSFKIVTGPLPSDPWAVIRVYKDGGYAPFLSLSGKAARGTGRIKAAIKRKMKEATR